MLCACAWTCPRNVVPFTAPLHAVVSGALVALEVILADCAHPQREPGARFQVLPAVAGMGRLWRCCKYPAVERTHPPGLAALTHVVSVLFEVPAQLP